MPNENDNAEVDSLIERAEEYARFVTEELLLEHVPGPPVAEIDDASRVANILNEVARVYPKLFQPFQRFVIHHMFPNLTGDERSLIEQLKMASDGYRLSKINADSKDNKPELIASCTARLPDELKQFEKIKQKSLQLEPKLTALQIEVLDSYYFNWPKNAKSD